MGLFKWLFGEVEVLPEHFEETEEYKQLKEDDRKLGVQIKRNDKAYKLEKAKEYDKAIKLYQKNIDDGFCGVGPYLRLAIIYRKLKDIDSEIKILENGIKVFTALNENPEERDVSGEINKCEDRLQKAKAILNK
jgi:tetratricopeptide (TPR) repeat protein